jgi:hypothetical protein
MNKILSVGLSMFLATGALALGCIAFDSHTGKGVFVAPVPCVALDVQNFVLVDKASVTAIMSGAVPVASLSVDSNGVILQNITTVKNTQTIKTTVQVLP